MKIRAAAMVAACASLTSLGALASCAESVPDGKPAAWVADTSQFHPGPSPRETLADRYRDAAAKIIAAARADRGAYAKLQTLTDRVGHRLSGSPELDHAIEWAQHAMADDGHDVQLEKVMVPHWVRGAEDAQITAPVQRDLHVIGLGGTVGTPKGGVSGPIVVVHDWTELEAKRDAVKGAIVVYDVAMPPWTEAEGSHYGEVVQYRWNGASRAAKLGAVAVLMRSVTAHSLRTPHAGSMSYDDAAPKIPALAVTVEDAELLARLAEQGQVTVHLHADDQQLADAPSANVIGEFKGKDKPDEVVVLGAHLDSWDVGQGAHDDGAGCVTMMQALTTLRKLGLQPRRTIRVVLFTNEENGVRGGKTYAADHAAELGNTVFAFESDSGGFAPRTFGLKAKDAAVTARAHDRVADIAKLVAPIGVTKVSDDSAGADVSPMIDGGVVAGELGTLGRTYFDIHHTDADTLDKVDPQELADDVAAVAVLAYVVADMPDRLDAP
jgi:Zn-dependent M28 family amino/carboxypeptidase|nr:M20/M25/M40 family metallo-hydrolase [Kofleriaceae bacterium]